MKSQTLTVILNPQTGIITYAKPNGDALLIEQENVKLLLLLTMPDAPPIAFIKASQQAKKKVFTDSDSCKMGK